MYSIIAWSSQSWPIIVIEAEMERLGFEPWADDDATHKCSTHVNDEATRVRTACEVAKSILTSCSDIGENGPLVAEEAICSVRKKMSS